MTKIRLSCGASVLLAAAMFAAGPVFGQTSATTDVPSDFSKLQDTELRLVRFLINGNCDSSQHHNYAYIPEEGQISGRSAVNNYGGVFTAMPNGKIAVQLTRVTQMAGPPESMELEREYFDALSHVKQIRLKSDRIVLENETTSMEFAFNCARSCGGPESVIGGHSDLENALWVGPSRTRG